MTFLLTGLKDLIRYSWKAIVDLPEYGRRSFQGGWDNYFVEKRYTEHEAAIYTIISILLGIFILLILLLVRVMLT